MKIQICLLAVFLLGISCAPLPEETSDAVLNQKQEQKPTEQLPIEELNTKEIKKEEKDEKKTFTNEPKPEIKNVPDVIESRNIQEKNVESYMASEKIQDDKVEEPKALPVEEKRTKEELNLEESKPLLIEEKKVIKLPEEVKPDAENDKNLSESSEEKLLEATRSAAVAVELAAVPAIDAKSDVDLKLQQPVVSEVVGAERKIKKENLQVIESKSVSLEEPSKNELDSSNKKASEEIKDDKLSKLELTKEEKLDSESESRREEKKSKEDDVSNKSSNENEKSDETQSVEAQPERNQSKQNSAESDESRE